MNLNRFIKITIKGIDQTKYPSLETQNDELLVTQENFEISVNDKTFKNLSNYSNNPDFGIVSGSMNLNEILCDGKFELGSFYSDKFEVELFNLKYDVTGKEIEVVSANTSTTPSVDTVLFTGYIDSSEQSNYADAKKIIAYDKAYYIKDTNVADWWTTYWNGKTTTTLKALRESLCTYVGLTNPVITLPNDDMQFSQYNEFTAITFGDLIRMIGEAQGCIPHFSRSGVLEYKVLDVATTHTLSNYDKNDSIFEDYNTKPITGINIYNSSNEFIYNFGTTTNAYIITGNIFLMSLSQSQLTNACNNIYNVINGINYTPSSIKMIISDLSFGLGKRLDTDFGKHFIMSQTFSGSQFVDQEILCEAEGENLDTTATNRNKDIIEGKRWSTIQQTVDAISTEVNNINIDLNNKITNVSTSVEQTATNVTTRILRDEKITTSFDISSTGVTISAEDIDTKLQLNANGVYIKDDDNNSLAQFETTGMTIRHWAYVETRNGNCLNIYKRRLD